MGNNKYWKVNSRPTRIDGELVEELKKFSERNKVSIRFASRYFANQIKKSNRRITDNEIKF